MTKEERDLTIEYLKNIQEGYIEGEGFDRYPLPEWYALNNAIESLEEESILINKIEEEINSPNRGTCDYFIVDRIEEIINEHKTESEVKK